MSHYTEIEIAMSDQAALLAALARLGFGPKKVEIHEEPHQLYGYQGDMRSQKAHIILRRRYVGSAINDIGFERLEDGTFKAHISSFDRSTQYGDPWIGKLKQGYGVEKAKAEARRRGYRAKEETLPNGRIRLTMSRR